MGESVSVKIALSDGGTSLHPMRYDETNAVILLEDQRG